MLIAITEHNGWENERWTYVLDLSKQKASAMNSLMIFVRLANEYYQQVREAAPDNPFAGHIFTRHTPKVFAASHYRITFYDSIIATAETRTRFKIDGEGEVSTATGNNYKNGGVMLDTVISPKKAHAAVFWIRKKNHDKKKNILYKDFESVFLATKAKTGTAKNK